MTESSPILPHAPHSPCVNICVIHPQEGICVGCYRTLAEIAQWSTLSAEDRSRIMDDLPARKPALKKRRGGRNGRRDP